jgi:kynurenine formamidase
LKRRDFAPDFVALSVEAARALVARGVRLVGLDYLSVAHADTQVPVSNPFGRRPHLNEQAAGSAVPPKR